MHLSFKLCPLLHMQGLFDTIVLRFIYFCSCALKSRFVLPLLCLPARSVAGLHTAVLKVYTLQLANAMSGVRVRAPSFYSAQFNQLTVFVCV